jgi:hypothetical protein
MARSQGIEKGDGGHLRGFDWSAASTGRESLCPAACVVSPTMRRAHPAARELAQRVRCLLNKDPRPLFLSPRRGTDRIAQGRATRRSRGAPPAVMPGPSRPPALKGRNSEASPVEATTTDSR